MKKIVHIMQIDTSPEDVFLALTLPDKLASWWTTEVGTDVTKAMLDFRFHEDFNPDMKIVRTEPDREVRWQCVGGHDEWHKSTITFGLEGENGTTQLTFVQSYPQEVEEEAYGRYNFSWGYYLDSLRQYCETGRGKPFQQV